MPGSVEIRLLEELADEDSTDLAECLSSGMLTPTGSGVGFRHELGRLAVEHALTPDPSHLTDEKAFRALASQAPDDLSALAHHADAAGNAEAVLRFAPSGRERGLGSRAPIARLRSSTRERSAITSPRTRNASPCSRAMRSRPG